jgi:3-isopropylmalate dehydratase small subunit
MNTKGFVHKYPDNVDTDVIIPARYLNTAIAASNSIRVYFLFVYFFTASPLQSVQNFH